jgi:hypothetical protein
MTKTRQKMAHTILLIQPTRSLGTRTFSDFESAQKALEGDVSA